jgi:molybdenum cofactor synthesis domain-containing protein
MSAEIKNEKIVTAAVLIIGNEILSGRTKDVNLGYLAEQLTKLGIRLREARVVADVPADIVAAVNECRARYDYVFTTGGIGPTHDDITSACVAQAFGVPLILDERARAMLERNYPPGGLNEARLRMAHVPKGGEPDRQPGLRSTRIPHGQCFRHGGRALDHARHVRRAER